MCRVLFVLIVVCAGFFSGCTKKLASVYDYLNNLPSHEAEGVTPYKETMYFLEGRKYFTARNYPAAFSQFYQLLEYIPDTDYETEALYYLSEIVPTILAASNSYISNYIAKEYRVAQHNETTNQYIDRKLHEMGLKNTTNGFVYDPVHCRNIVASVEFFAYKPYAYFVILSNDFKPFDAGETNKDKFLKNILLIQRVAQKYPTSEVAGALFTNDRYLPFKDAHFSLLRGAERADAYDARREIEQVNADIKPDTNIAVYVNGTSVKMREKIPELNPDIQKEEKLTGMLNDYDFATVVKIVKRPLPYRHEVEEWALVELETIYGPIRGWSYLKYVSAVSTLTCDEKLQMQFTRGLFYLRNHETVKAAECFSYFIKQSPTNYLADKACFLLWQANNTIGSCATAKNSEFYRYVRKYPLYYVYDRKANMLRSSNLLARHLEQWCTNSAYKFKINNDFILE